MVQATKDPDLPREASTERFGRAIAAKRLQGDERSVANLRDIDHSHAASAKQATQDIGPDPPRRGAFLVRIGRVARKLEIIQRVDQIVAPIVVLEQPLHRSTHRRVDAVQLKERLPLLLPEAHGLEEEATDVKGIALGHCALPRRAPPGPWGCVRSMITSLRR